MKKIIFAIAAISIAAGCSKDRVLSDASGSEANAIGFHISNSKTVDSKATPITKKNLTSTSFNVFAWTAEAQPRRFMDAVTIKYDDTAQSWIYNDEADQAYWPSVPLHFYAINPAFTQDDDRMWTIGDDAQTIDFNLVDEFADADVQTTPRNVDLMYSVSRDQTKQDSKGTVQLLFKHALSQVLFKGRTAIDGLSVNITEIALGGIRTSGTFSFPVYDENGINISQPAGWSGLPTTTEEQFARAQNAIATTVSDTEEAVWISDEQNAMMVIPQVLTKWATAEDAPVTIEEAKQGGQAYIRIKCLISHNGFALDGFTEGEHRDIYVPIDQTFEAGKRYIFTLIFGTGYNEDGTPVTIAPIEINSDVEAWEDAAGDISLEHK